ncbi:unnamed protein product, partial [Mesorhabditis spiculigera]
MPQRNSSRFWRKHRDQQASRLRFAPHQALPFRPKRSDFDTIVADTVQGLAERAISDAIAGLRIERLESRIGKSTAQHSHMTRSLKDALNAKAKDLLAAEERIRELESSHSIAAQIDWMLLIEEVSHPKQGAVLSAIPD